MTIVEFFDTRCPYCRKLEPTMADLLARDHGVRLVYKDLPILGPASVLGSKALLAAQKQGGYEKLRDAIMVGAAADHQGDDPGDAQYGSASTGSGWSTTWTIRRSRRGSTPI